MSDPISAVLPSTAQPENVDFRRTAELKTADEGADRRLRESRLRKASQDFESLFMYKLLKSMRATVPKTDEAGFGMETMREITDEQMAVYLAQQGGIGLGEMLFESLNRQVSPADSAAAGENAQPKEEMLVLDKGAAPTPAKDLEALRGLARPYRSLVGVRDNPGE
jgi:Rod binding domain-containing protein